MSITHTNDGPSNEEAGDLILWVLVWSELAAFGILLGAFWIMSMIHPESFSVAKLHLSTRLASLNTVVLLASGWQAALAARPTATIVSQRISLLLAAALGFVFAFIKLMEYRSELKFAGDDTFHSFFELYFLITGFHLAHVVFVAALFVLLARKPDRSNIVILATVWHVIDLIWLVMFPLIYLG
ncbi:MAG: cytochrome c oxidase subunit 3 [Pararhizobium sp.]